MVDVTEDDLVPVVKKAIAGDRNGALAAFISLITTTLTGSPLLGAVSGGTYTALATKLLDDGTRRMKAAEARLLSEESQRRELQHQLAIGLKPLTMATEELSEQMREQFLQTLRYLERHLPAQEAQSELLDRLERLIRDVEYPARGRDITWRSSHRRWLAAANVWFAGIEKATTDFNKRDAAAAIFHAGTLVKLIRGLDDRFRWIIEKTHHLREADNVHNAAHAIENDIKDIAMKDEMLSCLQTALGALDAISGIFDHDVAIRLASLGKKGAVLVSLLGDSNTTPFYSDELVECVSIFNIGEDVAYSDDLARYVEAEIERHLGVIDRNLLRETEREFADVAARLCRRYQLPNPEWYMVPEMS